ncbi:MAG: hypothetical protein HQL27_01455 [Candidatus Omnitrophica bacterium]|nr:hypothetical protein [Candidatus Omnitrophota bacterium]
MSKYFLLVLIFVLSITGCKGLNDNTAGQSIDPEIKAEEEVSESYEEPAIVSEGEDTPAVQGFNSFYVYSDKGARTNHYIPSGFMPNGNCLSFNDSWTEDCALGSSCIKIEYDVACSRADAKWAGIYWLNPPNNWGSRKGGFNLTGAKKLTFMAKGQNGGEQIQEFTIGGIESTYPDSDKIVIGPVILTPEWKEYTIDLSGKDLSYISGGFAWSTSEDVNPDGCTFYLDEIKFE